MTEIAPWEAKLERLKLWAKQRPATEMDLDTFVRPPAGGSFREGVEAGAAARAAGEKPPASVILGSWFFALLWEEGAKTWHLLAFLYPPGRGSCVSDWNFLGSCVSDWNFLGLVGGYLGVPLEMAEQVIASTHPNHTHRFSWKEETP